jgi:hypothetical protein
VGPSPELVGAALRLVVGGFDPFGDLGQRGSGDAAAQEEVTFMPDSTVAVSSAAYSEAPQALSP